MGRVFIFGIDGGTFAIIDELVAQGKLPFFARVVQGGAKGTLTSTIPPHTAPGWVSAVTGVGPGTHGVYQFWDTQAGGYIGKFMGSPDWGVPSLWKILNESGLKTGVVNVPMTHPPSPLDGYLISWPLSNTLRYSYPEDLLREIAINGGHYLPDISVMYQGERDYLDLALEVTEKRVKTIKYLLEAKEWDFMMTVFPEVDRISHFYWQDRTAIDQIYQAVDSALEAIWEALPTDTQLLVISDHGFGPGELNFNVQTFLLEKGFLVVKPVEHVPTADGRTVENKAGDWFSCTKGEKAYSVDWTKTTAYMAAPGSYGVNINLKGRQIHGIVDMQDFESVRTQLIQKFMEVVHPQTGQRLFSRVARSEELYHGERQKDAPDLVLIPENFGTMVNHSLVPGQWFSRPEQMGMHRREGMFLAYGSDVRTGCTYLEARLEDVLPTVLAYYGVPIPNYVEGRVLPVFRELGLVTGYVPDNKRGTVVQDSYLPEEQAEVLERLQALGYL